MSWFTNRNGKMRIINYLKTALPLLGNHCCRFAILAASLIVPFVCFWKRPTLRTYCRDWVVPFVRRFVFLLVVSAILLRCLAFAICKFDSLDVVRRATLYFAPYSSSVPFILVILAIALVCCIPGGPTVMLRLAKWIKSFGPLELFPGEDPDTDFKQMKVEAENEALTHPSADGRVKARYLVKLVSEKLKQIKQKKEFLLQQHAGRVFATISKTSIRTSLCPIFFDACLTQNDNQVFVRILLANSPLLMKQIEDIEIFCDLIPANLQSKVFVHIILYANAQDSGSNPFTQNFATIAEVENRIRNRSNLRLFRYSITDNNAVRPEC